jgi:O-methyltransferase
MLNPEELLINNVKTYTLCSEGRLKNLIRICNYLNDYGISGDFVECGTARGGSAAVISKYLNDSRHLWLYDSFEGMPKTTERDGEEAKKWIGKCVGTINDIKEVMQLVSTSEEKYSIKKGWFEQTFCQPLPHQVALLHCDADWYDSVTLVLETFYSLIPDGGCVILDDFGYWEGCREAFYDFCYRHNEKPLLERIEQDQAYWIKGKTHNRTLITQLIPGILGQDNQNHAHSQASGENLKSCQCRKGEFIVEEIQSLNSQLQQAQAEISAMQKSKFWQLRNIWIKLKKYIAFN